MPAFSRGLARLMHPHAFLLPSSLRATLSGSRQHLFQPNAARNSRPFTSSILRRYEYQYKSTLKSLKTGNFINGDPVLRQVIQTRQPVVLYEAPKSKWYHWKIYGVAAIWLGAGAYSIKFQDNIKEMPNLAFFIRPTYVVVGLSFVAIGCYMCNAPTNRMRSLEVLPSLMGGPLQVRMVVRATPFSKDKILYSNIGAATISEKTEPMVRELLEAERFRRQRVWQDMEDLGVLERIWEGSARWVHQKWTNFFLKFKFAVLRFGIAKVEVDGAKWKIDCSGYLLENGKAIDRIFPAE